MPTIIEEGPNLYKTAILLKRKLDGPLVWIGRNQMQTNTNEEPLTLEFNQKTFYFYATGIKTTKDKRISNMGFKNYHNFLSITQQEKVIYKFDQCIDHNDWDLKTTLLLLKINFLNRISKNWTNEIDKILSTSNTLLNPNIINFQEETDYLNKWIKDHKSKIEILLSRISEYNLWTTHWETTNEKINQRIKNLDASINTLFNTSNELIKKSDNLSLELINEASSSTKKLKTEEEIELNFTLAQEFINNEEQKNLIKQNLERKSSDNSYER